MAVTILERPQGYVLQTSETLSNAILFGGSVIFANATHGLVTGDFIYSVSSISSYNGFWYVEVFSATEFYIKESSTSDRVVFVNNTNVLWRKSVLSHNWSCVHLPIVYKLSSSLGPVSDAFATVDAFTNSSGNTSLTFTGAFSGSGLDADNTHVKIVGSSVDGLYRIVDTTVTLIIDLPYDSANVLAGAIVYVYYNNYHVKVQIYGGLTDDHYWEDEKPYELISTLRLTPDNNNELKFSISNELKKQVKTLNNNLTLDTLPNNIDAFTMFYITTQESYDELDGDEIVTFEGSIVSDKTNFEGFATNTKLPFKNVHSGFLSDYLGDDRKFLTLFEEPVIFPGYYFDLSIIVSDPTVIHAYRKDYYVDGQLIASENVAISEVPNGEGVYRIQLENSCEPVTIQIETDTLVNSEFDQNISLAPWYNLNTEMYGTLQWNWSPGVLLDEYPGNYASVTWFYEELPTADDSADLKLWQDLPFTYLEGNEINYAFYVRGSQIPAGNRLRLTVWGRLDNGTPATLATHQSSITGITEDHILDIDTVLTIPGGESYNKIGFSASVISDPTYTGYIIMDYFRIDHSSSEETFTPDRIDVTLINDTGDVSETKSIRLSCDCADQSVSISWLNYLGGMEYYVFTAQTEHQIDIKEAKTRLLNLFPTWGTSYGEFASTVRQETSRKSCFRKVLRSQLIPIGNLEALQYIKTSSLVQIVNTITDRRTVLVDTDSFTVYQDNDKEFSISFAVEYTDYIPAQSL
jgi:hypothetical protein